MESKLKDNKPKSEASGIELMMIVCGFIGFFSGVIYALQNIGVEEPDIWAWYSRIALGIICFGFSGVMRAIRKAND